MLPFQESSPDDRFKSSSLPNLNTKRFFNRTSDTTAKELRTKPIDDYKVYYNLLDENKKDDLEFDEEDDLFINGTNFKYDRLKKMKLKKKIRKSKSFNEKNQIKSEILPIIRETSEIGESLTPRTSVSDARTVTTDLQATQNKPLYSLPKLFIMDHSGKAQYFNHSRSYNLSNFPLIQRSSFRTNTRLANGHPKRPERNPILHQSIETMDKPKTSILKRTNTFVSSSQLLKYIVGPLNSSLTPFKTNLNATPTQTASVTNKFAHFNINQKK